MNIQLIAMDLDDTLLLDDWTISPRSVKAISEAQKQGVKITVATGRMSISAKPYAEQLGVDIPVITYNGAMVQQVLSGEILYRRVIPVGLAGKIVQGLVPRGIYTQLYLKDRVIVQNKNKLSDLYSSIAKVRIEEEDLAEVLASEAEGVEKILLMGEEKDLDIEAEELRRLYGKEVHVTKSKPYFLEMMDISVNKGVALAVLAKQYGINRENIMAIGDSFNDLEMLRYAGLGVAMGNAREEVKQAADAVTGTNADDGVAQAIEQFVLKK